MTPDWRTLEDGPCRLVPCEAEQAGVLAAKVEADTFRYYVTLVPQGPSEDEYAQFWREMMSRGVRPFRVNWQGEPVGQTCFMDIKPDMGTVEIGMTWYHSTVRGTALNPLCKRLMLGNAFELGFNRVTLKCDATNDRSRRAIQRIGGVFEGVLRRHGIRPDGTVRDTAMYSIIKEEWPEVEQRLVELINRSKVSPNSGLQ